MHFTMEYPLNASTQVILFGELKEIKKIKTIVALSVSCWEDKARDIIFDKNHLSLSPLTSLSS